MPIDPARLHAELKALLDKTPSLEDCDLKSQEVHDWLGAVGAIVDQVGDLGDKVRFSVASTSLDSVLRSRNSATVRTIASRTLYLLQAMLPGGNAFIDAGDVFKAFVRIADTIRSAKHEVFVVDPWLSDKEFAEIAPLTPDGALLRVLTGSRKQNAAIATAAAKWRDTYKEKHPVEVRIARQELLHDRFIAIDGAQVWLLSQSLNQFAVRASATVVLFDDTLSGLKRAAYEAIWTTADRP